MNENITSIAKARDSIGVGSIVELKSGGPPMTVKTRTPDEAYVMWHDAMPQPVKDAAELLKAAQ